MGDGEKTPLKLNFDSKVRLEFRGVTITSDAGLLACRELDDALGLTDSSAEYLKEGRTGKNILHKLIPLLRQSIYSRLAGYDDTNDADRLSQDPAMRVVVGWKGPDRKAASTSEMSRFETELLTQKDNRKGLEQLNVEWVKRGVAKTVHRRIILDIDSSESPVHGQQEGAAYNGHFECMCYHPLFCFNQFGDCEGAVLRPGNVHSADGWEGFIEPIVERYLKLAVRLLVRADIEPTPPLPSLSFTSTQSWDVPRRVIAKVEWHQGELFPRVGFIVTNLSYPTKGIVSFYNGRGTAEQWIKEGKYALNCTRLSCHKFVANQVRLSLFSLAYNLGNFLRRLALPESIKRWSLTSVQTRLIKTGGVWCAMPGGSCSSLPR